ncbi:MAG: Gfo/Idh/MocA family oxidoreductase, partial [Planctomycetota bacterium]
MGRPLSVAMVGTGFMGRAHSNAWMSVNQFFDPPRPAVMATCVDIDADVARTFAARWGWSRGTADVAEAVADESVDLVDVV